MEVDPEHSIGRHNSRASRTEQHDEQELAEFGYKQELRRDWGLMHNFGISFSIIVSYFRLNWSFERHVLEIKISTRDCCRVLLCDVANHELHIWSCYL